MALLLNTKPLMLSPQESDPTRLPSRTEEERAGPRKVVPEAGSKEALRRERLLRISQGLETASREPSPTPSSSSSPSENRELHSSLHLSADSSPSLSSSSVRTPSPPSPNFARREPAVASGSSSFDNQSGFSTASTSSYNQEDESAGPSVVVMMLQDRYAGMSKDLWKPDGDAEVCDGEGCTTKFGLFSARKHHCRKCGYVFCAPCSSNSYPLTFPTPSGPTSNLLASASSILPSSAPSSPTLSHSTPLVTPPPNHSLVPSRVCLPCHNILTSPYNPPTVRPSISRRSSRTPTLAPSPRRTPSHSRSPSPSATTRFGMPHPSGAQTSSASSSLSVRTPTSPYEPWMDGPLKEFPLAWPRQDRRQYGPGVQVLKRERSQLRREGSLGEVAPYRGGVQEDADGEEAANEDGEGTPRFNPRSDGECEAEEGAPQSYGVTWSTF